MTLPRCFFATFLLPAILLSIGCGGQGEPQNRDAVTVTDVDSNSLTTVIDTESGVLAGPTEIMRIDDGRFAVMDRGRNSVLLMNEEWEETGSFGSTGSGPGEWDEMRGAGNLIYGNGRFVVSNRAMFRFDFYDLQGNFMASVPYAQYMNYQSKAMLPDGRLLVATEGQEDALAVILGRDEEANIVSVFGEPEPLIMERVNIEAERTALASEELTPRLKNQAIVQAFGEGYLLMMNGLGELRYYSQDGDLVWTRPLPETVTSPIFDLVVRINEESRPHTMYPLEYAFDMKTANGLVYVLTATHTEAEEIRQRLLVYDESGSMVHHYRFNHSAQEMILHQMAPIPDGTVYFTDPLNAEIVQFSPDDIAGENK
ncbi:hypothetical protein [Rhodohalobacter mucosus]|uniref:6-bladed beta-propeller protein n=1 Tax=Rhodohalobacter mucosus TaxID=2079485 RepID=A0A316TX58_9BACT|nr:hypothetical protein [Rhodohalobacter mucosus]PWN08009.1 hypothetical protein DDZ15_03075 [Rhodohalobacter mucosus]